MRAVAVAALLLVSGAIGVALEVSRGWMARRAASRGKGRSNRNG